jgi:hypothetical protein
MVKHPIRRKPSPPAYAVGMLIEDYDWSDHRYIQAEDGGCAVSLHRDPKPETKTTHKEPLMAATQTKKPNGTAKNAVAPKVTDKKAEGKNPEAKKPMVEKKSTTKVESKNLDTESKDNFATTVRKLLDEKKRTDQELTAEMEKRFPETPNVLSAVRWHRWKYNILLAKDNKTEVSVYIRDAAGKLVEKSASAPVPKKAPEKSATEKPVAKPIAKPAEKVPAAALVKKTIIKKPIAKKAED